MNEHDPTKPGWQGSGLGVLGGLSGPSSAKSLASYFGNMDVRNFYYRHQTVHLDGYKFANCRFDNCVLIVNTPNFELVQCVIDDSTTVQYGPGLVKVLKLFNSRFEWASKLFPYFSPQKNVDGTITISDRFV